MLRPFWLHQAAEYLIGLVLVAVGPAEPRSGRADARRRVVILNAALVDGPLGAFRLFSRRAHRVADLVVIGSLVVARRAAVVNLENASRIMIAVCAVILGFVWWNSSFERRPSRRPGRPSPATAARRSAARAGRAVGGIARVVRDRTRN